MRMCLKGKMISLTLVGLGGFLIGGAVGLALGSSDEENDRYICSDDNDEAIKTARKIYKNYVGETYAINSVSDSEQEDYIDEEFDEVISNEIFVNEDGVEIKETSEGLMEIVEPYIISEDEYLDPMVFKEFERCTVIYYEGDDTLATDRDEVITDVEEIIGSSALTNFGNMSSHKDVVYVRNVRLGANFEVLRESGSYQEIVLGLSPEDVEYEKAKKFFKSMEDDGK